jgi:hypothetical protein
LSAAGLFDSLLSRINQRLNLAGGSGLGIYQQDPLGFGEKVLGETYTQEIRRLMESVRDNPITVAKSANAVGKTHGAARVAIWFYKCFPSAQVYTAAAPPESNLKKLLWGEIGAITFYLPKLLFPQFK